MSITRVRDGVDILHDFASAVAPQLLSAIHAVAAQSPFRRVVTPYGKMMSVEMTNCGQVGWVSDQRGYRYEALDPLTGQEWPKMPDSLSAMAVASASAAGYADFRPDVCLINRYRPGTSMGMHQDKDERDLHQPIVSVSLGLPIRFKIGGPHRGGPTKAVTLSNGDVLVFGGVSRLAYHGVGKLREGDHPLSGRYRFNLTFRKGM